MEIIKKVVGLLGANCYIIRNETEAVVIDPGGNPELIYPVIGRRKLLHIINTHGHYDHIGANNDLKSRYDTKLACHRDEYQVLVNPELNLSEMVEIPFISVMPDILLNEGDKLEIGGIPIEVLHTPGHTKGSISLKVGKALFSGDTLFFRSVGRTDLPMGSFKELEKSIREKLYTLPDETIVYTGHGENTTIGEEKKYNEFVKA